MNTNIETSLLSVFKSATDNGLLRDGTPDLKRLPDITFREFIECIKTGRNELWKYRAKLAREAIGDKRRYDDIKKHSPAVTIWGTFAIRRAENAEVASGLMAIDLDRLGDMLPMVFNALKENPYVVAVFRSIGGNGLCVIHRVNPDKWAESFEGLEVYYAENYRIVVSFDSSVKDINRLRFVSYDPECYVNYKAHLFRQYVKKQPKSEKPKAFPRTDDDIQYVIDQINDRKLDITQGDGKWVKIGMALINKYGESGRSYFHQICQYHPEYDKDEADKKYDYWSNCANGSVTIASFYYLAKQSGLDTMTRQTKELIRYATQQKKNGTTFESAVKTVAEMTEYTVAEAEPITRQVYDAREEIDTEETKFERVVSYLRVEQKLYHNELSRRIEKPDGTIIEGKRKVNSLYNEILILLNGEVKRSDFESLLYSDKIPSVEPLSEFFAKYKCRTPIGVIARLAASIETDTGFEDSQFAPSYVEYFLRKWLISLVAIAFGELSDLMLILTGPQGSGKTEFFRRLPPIELSRYYVETKLDRGKDDEILMCENWIVMLDELSSKTFQDVASVKALLSRRYFTLREPYGSSNVTLQRKAVLCGTSNPKAVLFDDTGNRRIIPINVLKIDRDAYNAVDKIDLLMEAYHAWKAGEGYQLSAEDIQLLNHNTAGFEKWSIERQLLERFYAKPTGAGEIAETVQAVDIQIYLEQRANNRKLQPDSIKSALTAMGIEAYQKRMGKDPLTGKARRPYVYDIVRLNE